MQANKSLKPPDFELVLSDISCLLQEKKNLTKKKLIIWYFDLAWRLKLHGYKKYLEASKTLV